MALRSQKDQNGGVDVKREIFWASEPRHLILANPHNHTLFILIDNLE